MSYPPRCPTCDREMRPLSGAGRWTWFCPSECDRLPPEQQAPKPRCPKCRALEIEPFMYMFAPSNLMRCRPCGHVWTKQ